jgi:hypothetical protein
VNTFQTKIKHGDRVTILVPNGIGRDGIDYVERTGKAVMLSAEGGWVLNMGGPHGTPGLASERNFVRVRKPRRKSAMAQAAEACGLKRVRVNGKTFYE